MPVVQPPPFMNGFELRKGDNEAGHEATRVSAAPRTDFPDTRSLGADRRSVAVNDKELG